jgi:glycosyltransferase involved in cell wall biosynthesis
LRIAFDIRTLRDDYPGIGRLIDNLLRALLPQLEGDTLVLLHDPEAPQTRYDLAALREAPGVEWVEFAVPPRSLSQQWKLPALLRHLRVDLLHAPYYFTAYRGLPCPLVVSVHDLIPLACPQSMPSPLDRLAFGAAVRLAVGAAQRVLTCSQATRNDLVRLLGTPADKVTVTPYAAAPVFMPLPAGEGRRMRELYRVPPRYFLHVGTNKPHKNLETLLDAYYRYYTMAPVEGRASLVLVGPEDPRYVSSRRLVAQHGLHSAVLALGSVPDDDLRVLYSNAVAVAVPSVYEGFGLPALEAMACGAPVLAADATSLPEVTGDAALLLPPLDATVWAQALARIAGDPALQADLRTRGLARAAEFTWQRTASETLAAYHLLGGTRGRS